MTGRRTVNASIRETFVVSRPSIATRKFDAIHAFPPGGVPETFPEPFLWLVNSGESFRPKRQGSFDAASSAGIATSVRSALLKSRSSMALKLKSKRTIDPLFGVGLSSHDVAIQSYK